MKKLIFASAVLLLSGSALAQAYHCRTPGGSAYLSDRPCSGRLVYSASPTYQERRESSGSTYAGSRYQPPVETAPEWWQYLSGRCATLHDGLRTARSRGLKYETIQEMRRNYETQCGEEERDARRQLSRNKREQRKQKQEEAKSQALAQEQAMDQVRLREQQCGEARRILASKRRRTDLTEGELADLQRFEDNYRSRCER